MFDPMCQFDAHGNNYVIVEAHGRPGRHHVNLNEWDDLRSCYQGASRVLSNVSLAEAKQYVTEEIVASAGNAV